MSFMPGHFPGGAAEVGERGNDLFTKLLLHCDGTDASTSFPDSSSSPKTVTANGNAQVDTAQSMFGGASCLMDGTGDYLSVPESTDWDLPANTPFCVDLWLRPAVTPNPFMLWFRSQDANNFYRSYIDTSGTLLNFYIQSGGVNTFLMSRTVSIVANTWYHLAISRDLNNDWRMFVNGAQAGSTLNSAITIPNLSGTFYIGSENGSAHFVNGHIDEFRWTVGVPRFTSNFVPPTQPYV